MKFLFQLIIIALLSMACDNSNPDQQENHQIEDTDDLTLESETEEDYSDIDENEIEWTQIIACNVGTYQKLAIMTLHSYPAGENDEAEIEGTYFYVKHQKILSLKGHEEVLFHNVYLTESYKEEETGYIEFNFYQEGADNFWSNKKGSSDKQEFNGQELLSGNPYELTAVINYYNYELIHDIDEYMSETGTYEAREVKDELYTCIINEDYLAFEYNVIRNNYHIGGMSGIAEREEDGSYLWVGIDDFILRFIIEGNEIEIREVNYIEGYYGGANVHFDNYMDLVEE